ELDLEATLDPPARLDVLREVHVQRLCELRPLLERALRVGAAGQHEEAVRIAVQHVEAGRLEPPLRPERELAAHPGDRIRERGIRESARGRSEEHTSELQSRENLVCRLLLEKK